MQQKTLHLHELTIRQFEDTYFKTRINYLCKSRNIFITRYFAFIELDTIS